eukprot:Cvel_9089.t2-p1 / transcript=Cvel_9089.t2 / gene=Cvel_9089 / organism=Chromera_velia_CCMP2878 / gene_product=hypothetical protein / transcript_product=hypothetical protein / location=Cvel_scaffold516:8780-10135(+) / protein_length=452 / sequence_SO=supercontig / SO=protein_coding / is_pseudo=false
MEMLEWKSNPIYAERHHPEHILMWAERQLMPEEPEMLIKGQMSDWDPPQPRLPKEVIPIEEQWIPAPLFPRNGTATDPTTALTAEPHHLQQKQVERSVPQGGVHYTTETNAVSSSTMTGDEKGRTMTLTVDETLGGNTLESLSCTTPAASNRRAATGPTLPPGFAPGTPNSASLLGTTFGPLSSPMHSDPAASPTGACSPFQPSLLGQPIPLLSLQQWALQLQMAASQAALTNQMMPSPRLPTTSPSVDVPMGPGAPASSHVGGSPPLPQLSPTSTTGGGMGMGLEEADTRIPSCHLLQPSGTSSSPPLDASSSPSHLQQYFNYLQMNMNCLSGLMLPPTAISSSPTGSSAQTDSLAAALAAASKQGGALPLPPTGTGTSASAAAGAGRSPPLNSLLPAPLNSPSHPQAHAQGGSRVQSQVNPQQLPQTQTPSNSQQAALKGKRGRKPLGTR